MGNTPIHNANTLTFAAGVSAALDTKSGTIMSFETPSGGANNATLTFQVSHDGSNYTALDYYDGSAPAAVSVGGLSTSAPEAVSLDAATWRYLASWQYIKLVNSGETSDWVVITRPVD